MINFERPYYMKNKDWWFLDPRISMRNRLTSKAPKKAVESWIEDHANFNYPLCFEPNAYEIVMKWLEEDREDYKKNGKRYTIDKSENIPRLVAIDGIPIEEYMKQNKSKD